MVRRPMRNGFARAGAILLAAGVILAVAGCGGADESGPAAGDAVRVEHNYGSTDVAVVPQRIITLGSQWLDATQAMGVTPVAYTDTIALGGKSDMPWTPAALASATVLRPGGDLSEQIAALEPDLILAPSFLVDRALYDRLSQIAPTVTAVTPNAQVDRWSDQVTVLGRVLHRPDDATRVIAEVNAQIDGVAAKYPNLKGKTFLTCMLTGPAQLMVLADQTDGSAALFERLGMSIPANIRSQAPAGGRLALSPERLDELTSDLLVCGAMPQFEQKFKQLPGYGELPAVRSGGMSFVDQRTISAINTPTPLSVPYLVRDLEPTLAAIGK